MVGPALAAFFISAQYDSDLSDLAAIWSLFGD